MAARKFPHWLRSFCNYGSFGEAPINTLFWTGVSTIAGALRRRVWLDMGYFQWVPNFYVILVANPGVISKSTTANIGMSLLREVQGVHFGPDVVTWQALVMGMAAAAEEVPDPETGELVPMSCLTIASSEFGNLINPQDREMVDIFVSLWDGQQGVFEKKTKTSGDDSVINPWLNIIACTTPAWISGNFPEYMIGGGFTSRCIFVYADAKRQLVAYPSKSIPVEFSDLKRDLIQDLERIGSIFGKYELDPAAYEWGTRWYEDHWSKPHEHLDAQQFGGYIARKQTHIHKLALVLAAAQRDERVVLKDDLEFAEKMVTSLEADMPKVFNRIGQSDITRVASDLAELIQKFGPMNQTALYQKVVRFASFEEFQDALNANMQAGYLKRTTSSDGVLISPGPHLASKNQPPSGLPSPSGQLGQGPQPSSPLSGVG